MLVRVVQELLGIIDAVLSHFYNISTNLTTTKGDELSGSLATILHRGAELYSKLLLIFTNFTG